MLRNITADEVKESVQRNKIDYIAVRDCSICGFEIHYLIEQGQVGLNTGCDCVSYGNITEVTWEDLAETVNMQTQDKWKIQNAKKLGIDLEAVDAV